MYGLKTLAIGWQLHRARQASSIIRTDDVQRPRRGGITRSRKAKQSKQQHRNPADAVRTCAQAP
jgi:hypothetical protein